jgi:hypothetical protein
MRPSLVKVDLSGCGFPFCLASSLSKQAGPAWAQMPWKKIEMERHNKTRTPKEERLRATKAIKKDKQRQQKIKEVRRARCG